MKISEVLFIAVASCLFAVAVWAPVVIQLEWLK